MVGGRGASKEVCVDSKPYQFGAAARTTLKISALGGVALAMAMFSSSAAMAQCTGLPGGAAGSLTQFASTTASGLISTINTMNTAFLTQTTAFISAPPNPPPNSPGGGIWVRGVGGDITTKSTTTSNWSFGTPATSGTATCNDSTSTSFGGVQAGSDFARLNVNGWNLHAGTTVGYAESTNDTGSNSIKAQVPFAGTYAAATKGRFFIDGLLFTSYYDLATTDTSVGVSGQHSSAFGVGLAGSAGYNFPIKDNWFIEPSVGFVWSRTSVDPFTAAPILGVVGGAFAAPATVSVDNVQSMLGRVGFRVGTTAVSGDVAFQPFFAASLWHEFADDVGSNGTTQCVASGFCVVVPGPEFTISESTSRVGTYGQYALGLAVRSLTSGWLGYIRADYRNGDNIEGWSVNGGLRYQFTPEMIADMGKHPIYKAPPLPPAYNWTGFYAGVNGGITYGNSDYYFPAAGTYPRDDVHFHGGLLGGQIGYNHQFGKLVAGLEGDFDWSNAVGGSACPNFFFTCEAKIDWLASATGRLGYTFWSDRIMTYLKGGLAAASVNIQTIGNLPALATAGESATVYGWTAGLGTEVGLTKHWSAKGEYMYYSLGGHDYAVSGGSVAHAEPNGSIARVGLNYRFFPN